MTPTTSDPEPPSGGAVLQDRLGDRTCDKSQNNPAEKSHNFPSLSLGVLTESPRHCALTSSYAHAEYIHNRLRGTTWRSALRTIQTTLDI